MISDNNTRTDDPPDGPHQGVHRLPRGVEGPPGERGFGDLLGGDAEEEHHQDLVGEEVEVEGVVMAQGRPVHHRLVPRVIHVRPDQRQHDAELQGYGELLQEIQQRIVGRFTHGVRARAGSGRRRRAPSPWH